MRDLYCVARGHDGAWEAICLDLNIAVQGRSSDEVRRLLNEAVRSYMADALNEAEPTRSQLLNRAVPFSVRAHWALRLLIATLCGGRLDRERESAIRFEVACPA
jgi:hypothetical protein